MPAQPILDFTPNGEIFLKTSAQIKKAIQARVHNELRQEFQAYMKEVQEEIDNLDSVERAGLFLSVMTNKNLAAPALLTRHCLLNAVACQKEIDELMVIHHNLQAQQDFVYKLTLEQATRYGLNHA